MQRNLDSFIDPSLQNCDSALGIEDFKHRDDVSQDVKDLYLLGLEGARSQTYFQSAEFGERIEELYQDYLAKYGRLPRNPPKPVEK